MLRRREREKEDSQGTQRPERHKDRLAHVLWTIVMKITGAVQLCVLRVLRGLRDEVSPDPMALRTGAQPNAARWPPGRDLPEGRPAFIRQGRRVW